MKKEFTVERDGKTFVLYAGLLDLAHERGLKSITTTLVQIPTELNGHCAIVHAIVELERGVFTGLGDASPENVNRMMAPHLIRMAETRAKARALRDGVNVGVTALEELADPSAGEDEGYDYDDSDPGEMAEREPAPRQPQPVAPEAPAARPASNNTVRRPPAPATQPPATPKQIETITRMARAAGKTIETDGLTRAQASEAISRLISDMQAHG